MLTLNCAFKQTVYIKSVKKIIRCGGGSVALPRVSRKRDDTSHVKSRIYSFWLSMFARSTGNQAVSV